MKVQLRLPYVKVKLGGFATLPLVVNLGIT